MRTLPPELVAALAQPKLLAIDHDLIQRLPRDAAKVYKKQTGGDLWAFTIPAVVYLVKWLALKQPAETADFLAALRDAELNPNLPAAAYDTKRARVDQFASLLYAAMQ